MTLKIDRESLGVSPEGLAEAVEAHKAALAEYAEHLKGVEADAADDSLEPSARRVAFPPPSAHPLVEQIVQSGAYELVGPSLAVRKQRLFQQVSEAEAAELAKVTPPGKARYWHMREQAIFSEDSARWNEHLRTSEDGPRDFSVFVSATRSDEDSRFLDEQEARRKHEQAIQFWAAKQHHDIEDLTEETVDDWRMEAING